MKNTVPKQKLPRELWEFLAWLYALGALCLLAELLCNLLRAHYKLTGIYRFPLLREHFPDFLIYKDHAPLFHTPTFFDVQGPFMYPAPVGVVYQLFYQAHSMALAVFLSFIVATIGAAAFFFIRTLQRRVVSSFAASLFTLATLAACMPVWFELRQANMEIVVWVLVTAGLMLFLRGRAYSAAACFGIAASMKIYPLAYLGLLLIRRQYRQIACGLAVTVASTFGSLWLLGGTIGPTWQRVSAGVNQFKFLFVLHKRPEIGFDHSLLSVLKGALDPFPSPERFAPVVNVYLALATVAGLLLFFVVITKRPVLNQILFLSVACILLPPVSFEYTLLHMLAPLALIVLLVVDAERKNVRLPHIRSVLACFALLLAPLSEVIFHGNRYGGQIKALALLTLLCLSLTKSFNTTNDPPIKPRLEGA